MTSILNKQNIIILLLKIKKKKFYTNTYKQIQWTSLHGSLNQFQFVRIQPPHLMTRQVDYFQASLPL